MLITSRFVIRIVDATVRIDDDIAFLIILLIVLNVVIGILVGADRCRNGRPDLAAMIITEDAKTEEYTAGGLCGAFIFIRTELEQGR